MTSRDRLKAAIKLPGQTGGADADAMLCTMPCRTPTVCFGPLVQGVVHGQRCSKLGIQADVLNLIQYPELHHAIIMPARPVASTGCSRVPASSEKYIIVVMFIPRSSDNADMHYLGWHSSRLCTVIVTEWTVAALWLLVSLT